MSEGVRILMVEDMPLEAELSVRQLRKEGIECEVRRVESESALRTAIAEFRPQVILSDFTLPGFDGLEALEVAREAAADVPFIFVSGTIGEERAIEALKRGAADYVLKTNLARLASAVRRALEDAAAREARQRQEAQIARLTRVLRMLSGVNAMLPRAREHNELLKEACRLAVSIGGYAVAVVLLKKPRKSHAHPVAWVGTDSDVTDRLRTLVGEPEEEGGIIAHVMQQATVFASNDTAELDETAHLRAMLLEAEHRSLVVLPLTVDGTAVGAFLLTAREKNAVSDEELDMLREVAGNISFALQYLNSEHTVRRLSYFDPQTGLAKRQLFCERLDQRIEANAGRQVRHAVAVIDIERLSAINDSFGRYTGDRLLEQFADRMRQRFHGRERLAHLGGGTFAVMLEHGGRADDLLGILDEHVTALAGDPYQIEGRAFPVSLRSGAAASPEDGREAHALLQKAEAALRKARASGERTARQSAEAHAAVVARLSLEHKLRAALSREQFELHYQPKVSIRTGRIEGVEALLRWRDPEADALVPPGVFLPILESTGLIIPVGEWVVSRAVRDCQHWMSLGLPGVRVAVNVSPVQLRHGSFTQSFVRHAEALDFTESAIDIEVTESALPDNSPLELWKLTTLRARGSRIALDDFGTGYSSLSRLSELPIDTLKIDRSFIDRLDDERIGRPLVSTIIALGRTFGMTTVAEGVETLEQLEVLRELGCDHSQGWLHCKALPRDGVTSILAHGPGGTSSCEPPAASGDA